MLKKKLSVSQILLALVMILISLTMVVPLLNILARSISVPERSASMSGLEILPRGLSSLNYQIIFSNPVLLPSILNSIKITVIGTLINVALTTAPPMPSAAGI